MKMYLCNFIKLLLERKWQFIIVDIMVELRYFKLEMSFNFRKFKFWGTYSLVGYNVALFLANCKESFLI